MKKTGYVVVIAVLAAIAGALAAAAIYLNRREKELEEYEQLLFSEEFDADEEADEEDSDYITVDLAEEAFAPEQVACDEEPTAE